MMGICAGAFFLIIVYQVQRCRQTKHLRMVVYSRAGIFNEDLDNAELDQYRTDFMEFDKAGFEANPI
jgi:hypothetical protein